MRRVLRFNVIMNKNMQFYSEFSREELRILLDLPFEYLKSRAKEENLSWDLDIDFFVEGYVIGVRNYYGLHIDKMGVPMYDLQEPKKGFLNNFIKEYNKGLKNKKNNTK